MGCMEALLPELMSSLGMKSVEEMNEIFELANKLQKQTPTSFRNLNEIRSLFVKQEPAHIQ